VNASIERQLAEQHDVGNCAAFHHAGCRQHAERDRQIERGAGLPHVGRRQVDGDALGRELEAAVPDCRAHPIAALAHARVGQPDHREHRQPERHVYFHVDRHGVDPEYRGRPDARQHRPRRLQRGEHPSADAGGAKYRGFVRARADARDFLRAAARLRLSGTATAPGHTDRAPVRAH
jgi:hypothetical protein